MRTKLIPLALLAAAALPLGAQGVSDGTVILGPQFVSYKFGSGSGAKTVTELAIPFAVILPFGERFSIDISSAFANAQVKTEGSSTSSTISGLTDTQLRGNYTLGDNLAVLTLGVNLPTGRYTVPQAEQDAAGQIGSNFLVFPVPSMGGGLAATGGIAVARPVGSWNLGIGGSFRKATEFDAYELAAANKLRFQPGDEIRVRLGLDRPVGDGLFAMGVTYSKFGNNAANDTTFGTGDRALAQATYARPLGSGDLQLQVWDLYRAKGELTSGSSSPWENVANVNLAIGFNAGNVYVQPSAEERIWQRDGTKAGLLTNLAVRFRFNTGSFSVNPTVGYSIGKLYAEGGGSTTDITGFKATLLIRLH
ncbi:MAG TPA: hypothetical protein VJL28_07310 [Gemmatimonadaceae bacterium]|nr:hypothetical protein [Gemmatimonadaceae bacterium]